MTSHALHLQQVFQILMENRLVLNEKKCTFAMSSVEYSSHIVSAQGVSADPNKTTAMLEWSVPTDQRALRGFLGIIGYYRRFVQGYGMIAKPLMELTKRNAFEWNDKAQEAFERLKRLMADPPTLAIPDFNQDLLSQQGRPIAFLSQALSPRARQKSAYERELIAIVFVVQKWRHYLLGRHFIVLTDQRSLKFLTDQRLMDPAYLKWTTKLLGLDFEVRYRPGLENKAVDALSQQMMVRTISVVHMNLWEMVEEEMAHDQELQKIVAALQQGLTIQEAGGSDSLARHEATGQGLCCGLPHLLVKQACGDEISRAVAAPTSPEEGLGTHYDGFYGGIAKIQGMDTILVVINWLTKYAHFIPLAHPFSAKEVALTFIKEVVKLHGFPKSIISYKNRVFTTQTTPFQALYGVPAPVLFRGETFPSHVDKVAALTAAKDAVLAELKTHLVQAQQRMKQAADRHRRDVEFKPGEWVYLKMQPYRMQTLARRVNEKLSPRYYGLFEMVERIGAVAYMLAMPQGCRLHSVFHVSKLKKAIPPQQQVQTLPPGLVEDGELVMHPSQIVASRTAKDRALEYLVRWVGLSPCEDSWERAATLRATFPEFHLKDEVVVQGESIDKKATTNRFGLLQKERE
ncbi:uncharacterized protein LOC130962477 [Arachis stenosperma]|uniref:uncharacterized protein LOC130962477 n=1 Tax=Arachis stenosperma TaxID=217475 RepID=UPI0025AD1439|nr:uncharacterized protein LOC130962477 [Arachis stenosperma]